MRLYLTVEFKRIFLKILRLIHFLINIRLYNKGPQKTVCPFSKRWDCNWEGWADEPKFMDGWLHVPVLRGTLAEVFFNLWVFSPKVPNWSFDSNPTLFSNINSSLPIKYKLIPRIIWIRRQSYFCQAMAIIDCIPGWLVVLSPIIHSHSKFKRCVPQKTAEDYNFTLNVWIHSGAFSEHAEWN